MIAGGDVADGKKPNHERMHHGKLARPDVGENAEQCMFARAWIDVDAIARDPRKHLRFRLHRKTGMVRRRLAPARELVGANGVIRCPSVPSNRCMQSFLVYWQNLWAGYPDWLAFVVLAVLVVVALWLIAKLIMLALKFVVIGTILCVVVGCLIYFFA